MSAPINLATAKPQDRAMPEAGPAAMDAIQRLAASARYAPPKVVSFPIDALRVTGPISLAGNT